MARAISNEARALNNERIGGLDFWAPNIKYAPTAERQLPPHALSRVRHSDR
jgi:hypothetical protein